MKRFVTMLVIVGFLGQAAIALAADTAAIKDTVEIVKKAAALVAKEGPAAYPKINDPKGEFVKGSIYAFAFSLKAEDKGVLLAHLKEGMLGKSLLALKEPETNRKFAQDFVTIAESPEGKGWTQYKWPKPDAKEVANKATYIMKVPGMEIAVGAGIYDVTKEEAAAVAN